MVACKTHSQPARYALAGRDLHPQDDAEFAQRTPLLKRPQVDGFARPMTTLVPLTVGAGLYLAMLTGLYRAISQSGLSIVCRVTS